MATLTVYSGSADGFVSSNSAVSWATARAGASLIADNTSSFLTVGDRLVAGTTYYVNQGFVGPFDTSSLGSAATVTATVFSINVSGTADLDAAYTIHALNYDWGAAVTTADFRDGTALASLTDMGSKSIAPGDTGYKDFSDSATLRSWINLTGNTNIMVVGDNDLNNGTPTNSRAFNFTSNEGGGSTTGPKLVVTYTSVTAYVPYNPWPQAASILAQ